MSVDPNSTKMREKRKEKGWREGVRTPPLSGSLLPVVMVIRGFGQDYEIFYLVTSALLERTSKPARSMSVSLTPPVLGSKDGVCDLHDYNMLTYVLYADQMRIMEKQKTRG